MSTAQLDNSNITRHLGQTSKYAREYDPSLLVREPRQGNRTYLNLTHDTLPFCGYDIWNAYEVSAMTEKGLPVTAIAKIMYPCDNEYIVESKSIKLYLNSFNMARFGQTSEECLDSIKEYVEADLSELLNTNVTVTLYTPSNTLREEHRPYFHKGYVNHQKFHSSLLKSNCRVTGQPDWGDVFIYMKSMMTLRPDNLAKYIVSFRDENHFHEEICECIYKRLLDKFNPTELAVTCLYARRGGSSTT